MTSQSIINNAIILESFFNHNEWLSIQDLKQRGFQPTCMSRSQCTKALALLQRIGKIRSMLIEGQEGIKQKIYRRVSPIGRIEVPKELLGEPKQALLSVPADRENYVLAGESIKVSSREQ